MYVSMFLCILSDTWSVYSSEPGEIITTAIKCLRNKPRQYHSNVSGVFFSGTFGLLTKTSYGEVELNDNYCFTGTYRTLDCIA